jgi:hypothetical protein
VEFSKLKSVALVKNRISNPPSPNSGSSQAGFSTRAALEVFHHSVDLFENQTGMTKKCGLFFDTQKYLPSF